MTDRICSIPACPFAAVTRGWCGGHYRRWRLTGDPGVTRLSSRIDSLPGSFRAKYLVLPTLSRGMDTACWEWTAYIMPNGYGRFRSGGNSPRGPEWGLAHRWSWTLYRSPVSENLHLDHLCHTADSLCPGGACLHRRCVNPDHLEPVTPRENLLRSPLTRTSICAARTQCPQGHPYDEINTYTGPEGGRQCKICRSMHHLSWKVRSTHVPAT